MPVLSFNANKIFLLSLFFCRLILTRDNPSVQLIVMEVLKQVIKAAQETFDTQKKKKIKGIIRLYFCNILIARNKSDIFCAVRKAFLFLTVISKHFFFNYMLAVQKWYLTKF
jgi:hypothetical protein